MSELKEELARCCGTVADKEAMAAEIAELEQRVTDINRIAEEFREQRDAAKASAKQLAADLEYSRHSCLQAQYRLAQLKAVLDGMVYTQYAVDLDSTIAGLRDVATGLESIDNVADARLVRRAGNLLDLFNTAIVDSKHL